MTTGWGLLPWGLGPYGLAAFALIEARAFNTNTVLVTLTAPAQTQAPFAAGDALNPLVWQITDTITGQV